MSCGLLGACLAAAEWRGSKAGPQEAGEDERLRRPAASSAHADICCVIGQSWVHKSGRNFWPAAQAGKQVGGEDDGGLSVERFCVTTTRSRNPWLRQHLRVEPCAAVVSHLRWSDRQALQAAVRQENTQSSVLLCGAQPYNNNDGREKGRLRRLLDFEEAAAGEQSFVAEG